ncbi:cyclase [Flavobacteriales bacterium]|nr:Imidazole glycerol phosphate synthase subunit HisF [Flavobacteriales bacterium]MCL4815420.1 imidazole glycerol phosphate synthase subunit HisF [Flavobacteriales bacterium]WKZ75039.1 MAG: imidazole glycerol phosphate synthase subunit HisF [Vicingaceae bacterium]GIK69981.1 MAG: imidazole glycerol phosphate synthase subunit HisF [Bacteroidota bacterium]CAG0959310.1 cyclase [Flavobacteriales bacterium]
MLAKRIIPCLDIKNGRTVKGVRFENLQDAGNSVELAKWYANEGADELVFLDITATNENRGTLLKLVKEVADEVYIPFTVGGGIRSVEDVAEILYAGADKISVNSAAFNRPKLITEVATRFGSQCVVLAVDAKQINGEWMVYLNGGTLPTQKKLFDWCKEAVEMGVGEILFTSMDNDGTKNGFANNALCWLSENLNVPIIASGGAGSMLHFLQAFTVGKADATLAASVFHYKEIEIKGLKKFLSQHKIEVRI